VVVVVGSVVGMVVNTVEVGAWVVRVVNIVEVWGKVDMGWVVAGVVISLHETSKNRHPAMMNIKTFFI
jgi:hypothetical protein